MPRQYYSKNHYRRLSNGEPDTQESIRERLAWIEAGKLGHADCQQRFADLSPENIREALTYQEERIRHHYTHLMAVGNRRTE